MSFDHFPLDSRIQAGIRAADYVTPTPIQEEAIPLVLEGRDVLGMAETGTGKTAAFVLPILQRLLATKQRGVRALILAPTRELAEQTHQAIGSLGARTGLRSATIYGGVSKGPQIAALRRGVPILVACPGRLLDHAGEGDVDLSRVEVLVLDEADRMCDMGFLPDIRRILRQLPARRQTLFFSATMPADIRTLAASILHDPVTVQIGRAAPVETVSHALFPTPWNRKTEALLALLEQTATGRVLVFTRTKRRARTLSQRLAKNGYRASELQGNMTQNRRQQAIDGFRNGKYDILVATDVAARGIDVADISHVINYDMPDTVDAYTHRIGRTGRAQQSGEAYSLATREDEETVRGIENLLGTRIERRVIAGFEHLAEDPASAAESVRTVGGGTPERRRFGASRSRRNRPRRW